MNNKDVFWMACDSTEQLRAEYGPFHTREEAETEARKLGFGYLLRYEHILGDDEEIQEVRCVFVEFQDAVAGPQAGSYFSYSLCLVRRVGNARALMAGRGVGRHS